MNQTTSPKAILRADYLPPAYWLDEVSLKFDLQDEHTLVQSELKMRKNDGSDSHQLRLDGEELELISIEVDGKALTADDYQLGEGCLLIDNLQGSFTIKIENHIYPQKNTRLEGLYQSSKMYCTQCEAEGFRRITYFPDRPDVMAKYTVDIEADKVTYPVLLSNGNLIDKGELDGDRHWVRWQDPFPKPSYLFALVAGDLVCISDTFTTTSGRKVAQEIYVEAHNEDKCDFAMKSLMHSMKWDEKRFGREYDLDVYMIVAVDDFNMGAMENKGLNIFNSKYVLAKKDSATDTDFSGIEAVIGHEYFHNWSGNRVTCRDWFQLSLKEGLTVFRDQEFSADMNDRSVKRIEDVRDLRSRQFPEDAGPMAHSIRPDSYIEINNFYTSTVYEKGAEVIRMIHTLLGERHFRKGMDLYFERHDGQAVTCEDFVLAMEAASGFDLGKFRNWYSQSGTPTVTATTTFDHNNNTYSLNLVQSCKTQPQNKPFHIPFSIALLDQGGNISHEQVINFTETEQTITFENIEYKPVISLLRDFSAPVILDYDYTDAELAYLMEYDNDSFNRWEAAQRLFTRVITQKMEGEDNTLRLVNALSTLMDDNTDNAALRAEALAMPGIEAIAQSLDEIDIHGIDQAREQVRLSIATEHQEKLLALYEHCLEQQSDGIDPESMGVRKLKNICLHYLTALDSSIWEELVLEQYRSAQGMTDSLAAMSEICNSNITERQTVLDDFYYRWSEDRLVIDKWFAIQAMRKKDNVIEDIKTLTEHSDFELSNPNRVRSVVSTFAMANPTGFHAKDGSGYKFLADYIILLNSLNPQIAARFLSPLSRWKRYTKDQQALMHAQLERIAAEKDLSPDVYEIVTRSLKS